MARKTINLDEFNPIVEVVDLKKTGKTGPTEGTLKLVEKCIEIYNKMELGQSFVVEKKFLAPNSLRDLLKEKIADTQEYYLKFRYVRDGEAKITGLRIAKVKQKEPETTENNQQPQS